MMRLRFCVLLLVCAFPQLGLGVAAESGEPGDVTAQVDKIFAKWDNTRSPGCALAVIQDGRIVYKRGYGMANLDHDVPITPSTVFNIGSVSKQFTAAAIALLAQQGKLSLDDEVRKYISELPDFGTPHSPHQRPASFLAGGGFLRR